MTRAASRSTRAVVVHIYNSRRAFYHVCADDQPRTGSRLQQENWASVPAIHRGASRHRWVQPGGGESGYIEGTSGAEHRRRGSVGDGTGMGRLIHYDHAQAERIISVWPEAYGMGTAQRASLPRFHGLPIF